MQERGERARTAPRLATMLSAMPLSFSGTCSMLVIEGKPWHFSPPAAGSGVLIVYTEPVIARSASDEAILVPQPHARERFAETVLVAANALGSSQ